MEKVSIICERRGGEIARRDDLCHYLEARSETNAVSAVSVLRSQLFYPFFSLPDISTSLHYVHGTSIMNEAHQHAGERERDFVYEAARSILVAFCEKRGARKASGNAKTLTAAVRKAALLTFRSILLLYRYASLGRSYRGKEKIHLPRYVDQNLRYSGLSFVVNYFSKIIRKS